MVQEAELEKFKSGAAASSGDAASKHDSGTLETISDAWQVYLKKKREKNRKQEAIAKKDKDTIEQWKKLYQNLLDRPIMDRATLILNQTMGESATGLPSFSAWIMTQKPKFQFEDEMKAAQFAVKAYNKSFRRIAVRCGAELSSSESDSESDLPLLPFHMTQRHRHYEGERSLHELFQQRRAREPEPAHVSVDEGNLAGARHEMRA